MGKPGRGKRDIKLTETLGALRAALRRWALEARGRLVCRAEPRSRAWWSEEDELEHVRLLRGGRRFNRLRVCALGVAVIAGTTAAIGGALWWRLGTGPLAVDLMTPWLTAALEEKLGRGHRVEVGGTVLERDDDGRTALRLHRVVVRDPAGGVVATAPKAEVGLSSTGLLMGQIRAERLSLIGAEMALRIDRTGRVAVFSADDAPAVAATGAGLAAAGSAAGAGNGAAGNSALTAALAWLARLDEAGLDGHHLMEVGLQSGSLTVDDEQSGRRLTFENIGLSVTRLAEGGAAIAIHSTGADGPWWFNSTVTRLGNGNRSIEAMVRDASPKDILPALRLADPDFEADMPLSAMLRAEIGSDGELKALRGRVVAGAGHLGMAADLAGRILLDEVQADLFWDPMSRVLQVPMEIHSGPHRITLMGLVQAPAEGERRWRFAIPQGVVRLAALEGPQDKPLVLDRVSVQAHLDPVRQRLILDKLDVRGGAGGLALSGVLDYSGAEPRMILGTAGSPMEAPAFRRIWPVFVVPALRKWINENLYGGQLERLEIGTNMPLSAMRPNAPPLPQEGLSVAVEGSGVTVRPVVGLPPIRNARIVTRAHGRMALVEVERGIVDLPSGRRLSLPQGTFEIPDLGTHPLQARATFRLEGSVEAMVELLGLGPLRAAHEMPAELAAARGNVKATVTVNLPLIDNLTDRDISFRVEADVAGFSAERLVRGHKAEAAALKVVATDHQVEVSGEMRIGGAPATVNFRRVGSEPEATVVLQATLDQAARVRFGLDFDGTLVGPVPVKLSGRMALKDREAGGRFAVEVDLTPTRVDELIAGWIKPAGRPVKLTFALIDRGQSMRLEDFVLEGSGSLAKGVIELDGDGDLVSAHLPVFALSDGDKASLRAERGADGVTKVSLRGDVYDGRGLIKGTVSGQRSDQRTQRAPDLDLEMKLGAMPGFHGEALRSVDLKLSRRGGHIRAFSLSGRIGQEAMIRGDLRLRGGGRNVLYLESNDAGAVFRFTDIYARVTGGTMSMAMDPPVLDGSPREGLLNVRDFVVRGEPALDGMASSAGPGEPLPGHPAAGGVAFSRLRAEFTRSPGKFAIRDGVVWGPSIGATVEGALDYDRDQVRLRGTFVPAYTLNNLFSRLPILGMFLGGGANEGLLGVTYQVVGTPRSPVLQVNPISAVAPGFLRKLFEFRADSSAEPYDPFR